MNTPNPKVPTDTTKSPNSRINNNTRDPSQKLHNKENSISNVRKPIEKPYNDSNHILLSTSANTKTNVNFPTKGGTQIKSSVNNTKPYVNNFKTSNKTSTVNNKIKTQHNSTKNTLVTNKVVNKIISQSLISMSNKTASTSSIQTNKIKTNSTSNSFNKLHDKNVIPLRLNQSNIIKPNVEQLLKSQPNRLQGNILKHNTTFHTATKEYVKLPIKTTASNKTSTPTASLTKYEKISSSNNLVKAANGSTKAETSVSNVVNQTKTDNRTEDDLIKEINQEKTSTESVLKLNETMTQTETTQVNSSTIHGTNVTKTVNETSTFETSDQSNNATTEVLNDTLNANITSTETPNVDSKTSSDSILNEVLTRNETLTINSDDLKTENETIVERTKAGSIDSLENNGTTSNMTAGSAVRAAMSNKSVDLDYDYDSLPPSLPNLK